MYVPRCGGLRFISVSPRSSPALVLLPLAPPLGRRPPPAALSVCCGPRGRAVGCTPAVRVGFSFSAALAVAPADAAAGSAGAVLVTSLSSPPSTSIIRTLPCVTTVRGCFPGMTTVIVPPGHASRFAALRVSAAWSSGAAAKRACRAARFLFSSSSNVATLRTSPAFADTTPFAVLVHNPHLG